MLQSMLRCRIRFDPNCRNEISSRSLQQCRYLKLKITLKTSKNTRKQRQLAVRGDLHLNPAGRKIAYLLQGYLWEGLLAGYCTMIDPHSEGNRRSFVYRNPASWTHFLERKSQTDIGKRMGLAHTRSHTIILLHTLRIGPGTTTLKSCYV